jgi:hypothetical protein
MKKYKIELFIREENGAMLSFDVEVKAQNKRIARNVAKDYAKQKNYKLICMAFD